MTIDEAIKHAEEVADCHDRIEQIKAVTLEECKCASEHRQLAEWLRELKAYKEQTRWIPVKTRPLTDEELRFYYDQYGNDNIPEYMFDCPLPEDGQEILITFQIKNGKRCVALDICVCDEWGYYLENFDDFDGVIAWMPLPEPYKADKEEE